VHDLIIRAGHVIDQTQDLDAYLDVAIDGHQITAVGTNLSADGARQVVDATGLIVTPGLVDLHTHSYWGVPPLGIEPDPHLLHRGVTTAIDAGSAGASTFPGFRRYVIEVSGTRILALLNISQIGMAQDRGPAGHTVGELEDLRWARVDRAIEVAIAHPDVVVGIKVRLSRPIVGPDPAACLEALSRAHEAAGAIGKPVMVHIGNTPAPLDALLPLMKPGDLITHAFHGGPEGVLDEQGLVRPSVWQAIERGVGFDVGHGAGGFSFAVARRALDQGLLPLTISSDLHAYNVAGPVYDLVTTASKFLHLGLSLGDVLSRMTAAPARAIGMATQLGTLIPGATADVALLRLVDGVFPFKDGRGQVESGSRRLEAVSVIRAGKLSPCTSAPALTA
jgi:dihydroorotase